MSKASASQLWNPKSVQAMKGNNMELTESDKEELCVLVHVAKGYIFAMKLLSATT